MSKRAPILSSETFLETTPARVPAGETVMAPAKHLKAKRRPDQVGKRMIGALFPEAVYRQFKAIAGEKGMQSQELLAEMLNRLFKEHGRNTIA